MDFFFLQKKRLKIHKLFPALFYFYVIIYFADISKRKLFKNINRNNLQQIQIN